MPTGQYPVDVDSNTGAFVPGDDVVELQTGVAGAALLAQQAIYRDGAGLLFPLDGTQINDKKFVGITDQAYAAAALASYAPVGGQLPGAGYTSGDYWTDAAGVLVASFAAVPAGKATKRVANATSAVRLVVIDGEIIVKP